MSERPGGANLAEQIRCVMREIALRERVYPKFIDKGSMTAANAQREIDAMRAVLDTLNKVAALRSTGGLLEK